MTRSLEGILGRRPDPTPAAAFFEAIVTRSDTTGVWVTREGEDPRSPTGPCSGATHRPVASCPEPAHEHPLEQLAEGTRVLAVALADAAPWIVNHEER